jgi:hypothetical protein
VYVAAKLLLKAFFLETDFFLFRRFTSRRAGGGKTFALRMAAHAEGCELVSLRFNCERFLSVLEQSKHKSGGEPAETGLSVKQMLHLDVIDTIPTEHDRRLFQLLVQGCVFDCDSGRAFFLAESDSVAVEVASGSLFERLRVCQLLPCTIVTVTEASFMIDPRQLCFGKGINLQSIVFLNEPPSTKLKTVCGTLALMESPDKGPLPFTLATGDTLSAGQCHQLLLRAIKQNVVTCSWHSVWGYIEGFYGQLKQLHASGALANVATVPDLPSRHVSAYDLEKTSDLKRQVF